jgi:spore coat protein H
MKNGLRFILIFLGTLFVFYTTMQSLPAAANSPTRSNPLAPTAIPPEAVLKEPQVDINDLPLQDNPEVYLNDDPSSVVVIYVTVRKGNSVDNTNHTWKEVNSFVKYFWTEQEVVAVGKAQAIVQFGDENGPVPGELGYGALIPNATIQIRGGSSSKFPQKSYKIELLPAAGEWRGQSTFNLNKHPYDDSRVRNKLNFDLIKQIPNLVSHRTQFVRLYVKDETTNPVSTTFVDYGLFTQVEQTNRTYLQNHLLDPNGQLYKAIAFEFYRYPDEIRMADDPLYDEVVFSHRLEIKGNKDHSKLIEMLDAVNNYNVPIDETFEKYFDLENYFTWMAYNILVGNLDTQNQNFMIYSPNNSNKWYFIPWDYDGTFRLRDHSAEVGGFQYAPWVEGISNYWGGVLHNRVLKVAKYRQMLDDKINELRRFLSPERIKSMLDVYKPVTDPYISRMPDLGYFDRSLKTRDLVFELVPGDIQNNYELYHETLEKPMPFFLGTPKILNGRLVFNWNESYDFDAQTISYHFIVSTDWKFNKIVYEATTDLTGVQIDMLKPGEYFWRVTATNSAGKLQYPFDYYTDANSILHYGMKYLKISPDGQVLEK